MPATGAMVELLLGGTWTDVTARTYHRDTIQITRGRQDQGARVDPGSCTITFNNKDGRFSPRNPVGPYYGLIGRNTPVRVSAVGGTPWLGVDQGASPAHQATTPDAAALHVTGDLDVRLDMQPQDWNSHTQTTLIGRWGSAGNKSWSLLIVSGTLVLEWTADGTTSLSNSVTIGSGALTPRITVRATLDVNNGAGGKTVRFYTGPSLAGPWTQLGADQTSAGTTSVFAGTAPLVLGDPSPSTTINVFGAEVRDGLGGTVVASPDFTAQTPGATGFTDSVGRTWAVTAGGITNRRVRFLGEISSWPARWDVSGGDVYVPVQAAGIMRRLGQGASALDSTLRRRVPSAPGLIAYWPMEDGRSSTQAYSPIAGVTPMATSSLSFGSDDTLGGSAALPVVSVPASLSAAVPAAPVGDWWVELVYRIDSVPASPTLMLTVNLTGGTASKIQFFVGVGVSRVRALANDGSIISTADFTLNNFTDNWGRIQIFTSTSGGTCSYFAQWVVIGAPSNWFVSNNFTGTPGRVSSVQGAWTAPEFGTLRLGHLSVVPGPLTIGTSIYQAADTGFDGEGAATRYVRLCGEEGVSYTTPYGTSGTAALGPQRAGTFLDLLEEAQDADVGILYEARDSIALAYRTRQSLYNQTPKLALDYQVRGLLGLEPTEDDTATRNDVTISRPSGSAARLTLDAGTLSTAAPPLGVGRYATSESRNVHSDDQLQHLAGWLLHLGTVDEARYPAVTVNLTANASLIGPACTIDLGDLISIANLPAWLPPDLVSLMCQGYTETIGWADWQITYNCTPGSPWTVGVLDTPARGQLETAGSTLVAGVSTTATTLSVATTAGPLWTTTATRPADFPFKILIGGEVMTVTAITGTSSPQSFTVTRSTNGVVKAQTNGAAVQVAVPFTLAL